MPRACKGNGMCVCTGHIPFVQDTKEDCVFVQAIKCEYGYECVYVCLSSSTKSRVCVRNGSDPDSANKRRAPRYMCVCEREIKDGYGCVYVCVCHFPSPVNSYLCMCICMYMYISTTKRL